MPSELIDQYIDRGAIEADTKFLAKNLNEVKGIFESIKQLKINVEAGSSVKEVATTMQNLKKEIQGLDKIKSEVDAHDSKRAAAKAALLKLEQQELKSKAELQKLETEVVKTITAEEKAEQELLKTKKLKNQQSDIEARAAAKESQTAEDLTNDYLQLSKAYNEAALRAKNHALRLGETHPVTVEAVKDAKAMYDVLLRVDTAVGQSGRNVGNYKSAFDGLSMSFTQVARELPSLAVSPATFLLAISNNLPMVQDEIAKAKNEIKALKAEGKDAPSLFQRIGQSLATPQVGLSLLITVLTILGPKLISFISSMFDSGEAAKKAAKDQAELNEVLREQADLVKEVQEAYKTDLGHTQALKNDLAYTQAQNKSRSELLEIEKKIANERALAANQDFFRNGGFQKLSEANGQLIAAEQDYFDKVKEFRATIGDKNLDDDDKQAFKDRLELSKNTVDQARDTYNTVKKINEENANALQSQRAKEIEIETYAAEQKRKVTLESAKLNANEIVAVNDRVLSSEKSSLEQRLVAVKSNSNARRQVAQAELNDVLNDPATKGTAQRILALKSYYAEVKGISRAQEKEIADTKEEYRRRDQAAELNTNKQIIEARKSMEEQFSSDLNLSLQDRLINAARVSKDQLELTKQEYDVERDLAIATGRTKKELNDIEVGYNLKLAAITAETEKRITSILKDEIDKRKQAQDDYFEDIALAGSLSNAEAAERSLFDTQKLSAQYNSGKIQFEAYQKELAKINSRYQSDQAKATIDALQKQINFYSEAYPNIQKTIEATQSEIFTVRKLAENALTDEARRQALERLEILEKELKAEKKAAEEIAKAREAIAKARQGEVTKKVTDKNNDEQAKTEKLIKFLTAAKDIVSNMTQAFSELNAIAYEKAKARNDQELSDLEKKAQREIDIINVTSISEEEKANRTALVNARLQAQKEDIDRKNRKLDAEKARFDRIANIANLITGGALAVVNTLKIGGPIGIALAVGVAALVAAQIARAIATPIPKYKTGRTKDNPYEGPAWVGDGGKSESIVRADGTLELSPNKPTLTTVKKGDIIYPDSSLYYAHATTKATDRVLSKKEYAGITVNVNGGGNEDLVKELRSFKKFFDERPVHETHITEAGFRYMVKQANNLTEYINRMTK